MTGFGLTPRQLASLEQDFHSTLGVLETAVGVTRDYRAKHGVDRAQTFLSLSAELVDLDNLRSTALLAAALILLAGDDD